MLILRLFCHIRICPTSCACLGILVPVKWLDRKFAASPGTAAWPEASGSSSLPCSVAVAHEAAPGCHGAGRQGRGGSGGAHYPAWPNLVLCWDLLISEHVNKTLFRRSKLTVAYLSPTSTV